jgi:hypothetical protein
MELSLGESATRRQSSEEQGYWNRRKRIAKGDQPTYDPIESQIAEIPIVARDSVEAGDRGKIVIPGQTGHRTSQDKNQ